MKLAVSGEEPHCVGCMSDEWPATSHEDKLLEGIKSEYEEKVGKKFESLRAISERTQLVSGTLYVIKVIDTSFEH